MNRHGAWCDASSSPSNPGRAEHGRAEVMVRTYGDDDWEHRGVSRDRAAAPGSGAQPGVSAIPVANANAYRWGRTHRPIPSRVM
jgi:hypothetical protein